MVNVVQLAPDGQMGDFDFFVDPGAHGTGAAVTTLDDLGDRGTVITEAGVGNAFVYFQIDDDLYEVQALFYDDMEPSRARG